MTLKFLGINMTKHVYIGETVVYISTVLLLYTLGTKLELPLLTPDKYFNATLT